MDSYVAEGILDPIFWSGKQDKLEALWDTYYDLLLSGKTLVSWKGEGDEADHELVVHPLRMLAEIELCLRKIDPVKYGVILNQSKTIFV